MPEQIFVALKRKHRVEDTIPYIQQIAQPGMRVVFLIPYPMESWLYLRDHWVTTESPRKAMLVGKKITEQYSWELQSALAEEKIFPAREALQYRRVQISADLYTGSLRRRVRSDTGNGDSHLILIRDGIGLRITTLLKGVISFKRPGPPPVLVVHHPPA